MAPPRHEEKLRRVLAAFERAANAGVAAPTNHDLSLMLGQSSVSGPVPLVKELEARGLIRVERFHRERRVTIVATGKQTWADPREERPGRWAALSPRGAVPVVPLGAAADAGVPPPFRAFSAAEADAFDEALAEGWGIETAARMVGRLPLDGYRQFHRVCAELGEAPRPEIAASKNDPREAAAPRIRGQQGILA
jgi:DNA-binding MarR family transcriptional regulator